MNINTFPLELQSYLVGEDKIEEIAATEQR